MDQLKQQIDENLTMHDKIIDRLCKFQAELKKHQQINVQIRNILNLKTLIKDYIANIESDKLKLIALKNQKDQKVINDFSRSNDLQNNYEHIKFQLIEWLKEIDYKINKDSLFAILNDDADKSRKFYYKQMPGQTIKIQKECYSFDFNKELTILFIGQQNGKIAIYGFNNKKKIIQTLKSHTEVVCCLIFMKNSKSLISGSVDNLIIIWAQIQNNYWRPLQRLEAHDNWIRSMIINESEDLIISGSRDKKIKFWKKESVQWHCQQVIDVAFDVFSLSLNPSQNKLICCETEIKVIVRQSNLNWIVSQIIKIDGFGLRLSFINDSQFIFQQHGKEFMDVYSFEEAKQEYINTQYVEVQKNTNCACQFPSQFIKQKDILLVKNGKDLNLFRIIQNKDIILQQQIVFEDINIFGIISNDGQYLVIYDDLRNTLQYRKLQYLE